MDKCLVLQKLGGGSFGTVFEAQHQPTGEVVAIKYLTEIFSSFEQCLTLPEVQSLSKLRHPNIVQLKDVIFAYDSAFLVFEYMQSSLLDHMMKRRTKFTEDEVRSICFQMFQALAYMHRNGYFHRDLKPANILINDGARVVKIADLGSAMEIDSTPPYTDYATTRPYRAPEVLHHSGFYGPKVDMWAMGAVMAELFSFRPLFPGQSPDDQMFKICSVAVGFCNARPTAAEALRHPFFIGRHKIPRAIPLRHCVCLRQILLFSCSFDTSNVVVKLLLIYQLSEC